MTPHPARRENPFNLKRALLLSLLLCAVLELALFNLPFYVSRMDGRRAQYYPAAALTRPIGEEENIVALAPVPGPVRSVKLLLESKGTYRYTLFLQDDAFADGFREVGEFFSHSQLPRSQVATVRSNGNLHALRIRLNSPRLDASAALSGVILNAPVPFYFSPLRAAGVFILLFSCLYLVQGKAYCIVFDAEKPAHRRAYLLTAALCLGLVLFTFFTSLPGGAAFSTLFLPPVESAADYTDPYPRQLDAFLKGQVKLDVQVNPELAALENPYDPSARAQGNIPYEYDSAYYNGAYYSAFPPAPLLLYAPLYLLSGQMPSALLICFLFAMGFAVFSSLALYELARLFLRGAPALFVLLMPALVLLCGALLWCQRTGSFYEVPPVAAAMFLMLSLYFAARSRTRAHPVPLLLCGLGLILAVASQGVLLLTALPVGALLLPARRELRKGLRPMALLAPILLGAALLLYYNHARFGSLFETGLQYRLSISDMRYHSPLRLWNLFPAVYHYLLQIPTFDSFFPFFRTSGMGQILYHNYYYCWPTAGALAYPAVLCIPGGYRAARAQNRQAAHFIALCTGAGLLCAYLNFSLYGVFFRFTAEPMLLLSLATAPSIAAIARAAVEKPSYRILATVLTALAALSLLIGFCLSLDGYYGGLERSVPLLFTRLKYMLEWWR